MNEEIILDKLRKMLFTTQQANECGLSNNDFKEDIHVLSGAIGLIENLIQENKELKEELEICEADLDEMTISNEHKKKEWVNKLVLNSYIPKSKIKELLEHYKNTGYNELEEVLQELLEGE